MDSYIYNIFFGLLSWLDVGTYLWLWPQAIFNFSRCLEKQVCKCGQPIKVLGYYVIERYNAVLLLPREWDANKELTSRPMVHLHSNATFCTIPSELVKPFCCHQPPEQAALLFILAEVTLKRRNIPCFIVPLEKGLLQNGPSHWHEYSVASCGSLQIDTLFLGREECIKTEYSQKLEESIARIFETFDGESDVTFSPTQLQKRKDLESNSRFVVL